MNIDVKVLNQTTGAMAAYFSNRLSGGGAIHALEFERARVGGCCELSMKAALTRQGGAVACGNKIEVWVSSSVEASDRKYLGVILSIENDYTENATTIKAWGLWHQFEWQTVVQYIEGAALDTVIDTIFDSVVAGTYCNATPSISIASPVTLGDVEVDFQPASEIIGKLADVQGGVDYGVDEDGVFFFNDTSTTKRGHFQIGVNVADFKTTERADELYNDAFIKTRGIITAGNLMLHEDDDTSVAAYKKRSVILQAPELSDVDDAIAWAQNKVASSKDPVKQYSLTPILATQKHLPYTGTATLVDSSGATIGTFSIEGVKYVYEHGGLRQELILGDRNAEFNASKMLSDIDRKIRVMDAENISQSRIKHTGYDEFRQYVQQNAYSTSRYNVFVQDMSDSESGTSKTVEKFSGMRHFHWTGWKGGVQSDRHVRCDSMHYPGIVETIEIPTGRLLDSVRVYYHIDQFGRYNFNTPDSLQDWESNNCSDTTLGGYVIDNTNGVLVGNPSLADTDWGGVVSGRGRLDLQPKNWTRELTSHDLEPEYYSAASADVIRFRLNGMGGVSGTPHGDYPFRCWFNYKHGAPINYAELSIEVGSGSSLTCHLDPYLNSLPDTPNFAEFEIPQGADYVFKCYTAADDGVVIVEALDVTGGAVASASATMAAQTEQRFVIRNIMNSGYGGETGYAAMQWFEIGTNYVSATGMIGEVTTSQRIDIAVSRDAGTTWESYTPLDLNGWEYHDFTISGQPSGTNTLKLKATLDWPAVLYGFGAAWGGD